MASPNRLITLDTETTGLDAQNGDRIIEIGCVAIEGRMMRSTDEHHLQIFVNPEREVPEEAVAIHGITTEYLQDKPKFAEIADKFIDFVKGSTRHSQRSIRHRLSRYGTWPLRPRKDF